MGYIPCQSNVTTPTWATFLAEYHNVRGTNFRFRLYQSKRTNCAYGCAYIAQKLIEIHTNNLNENADNVFCVLHELAHLIRGKTGKTRGDTHQIVRHDEEFFRIAAKLYADYGESVLDYATVHEYPRGRKYMVEEKMKRALAKAG